jgi:hypothetical protein
MVKIVFSPGSPSAPCQKECGHIACQKLRAIAQSKCPICHAAIGYEMPYISYEERYFHKSCMCQNTYQRQSK